MKKDAYYFSHDSNAQDDPKCMLLIDQLGMEGYGERAKASIAHRWNKQITDNTNEYERIRTNTNEYERIRT